MFKILKADKDAYITNKFINSKQAVSGNTGIASSLDLFKLYSITLLDSGTVKIPQTELSRLLIHFDLDPLRELVSSGKVDITDESFKCHLLLKDVYGGQPTPNNFTIDVFPLSSSFVEGFGKDIAYYADKDICNFIVANENAEWFVTGCNLPCFSTGSGDYITSSLLLPTTKISQIFKTGEEDLFVDVTQIVSATLSNDLPDEGFRISYAEPLELNTQTYFVKRFASRHAFDETKHPKLLVRFNDSIQDDSSNFYLDNSSNIFLYNYMQGSLQNIVSASNPVTGSNSIILELKTEISGVGPYSLFFTGSQFSLGTNYVTGVYKAAVLAPLTDPQINSYFTASGSVNFTPIWKSLDGNLAYVTGSKLNAKAPERLSSRLSPRRYTVSIENAAQQYGFDEDVAMRVNVFDSNDPLIKAKRLPVELPGIVIKNAYYAIRNVDTNEYIVEFDPTYGSTKLSSDSKGMYITFNTSDLLPLATYTVDIMLLVDGMQHKYMGVSSAFRIAKV
jgi:hypothetical protein